MPMTSYHGAGYVEVRAKMRPLKSPPSRRVPRTGDLGISCTPSGLDQVLVLGRRYPCTALPGEASGPDVQRARPAKPAAGPTGGGLWVSVVLFAVPERSDIGDVTGTFRRVGRGAAYENAAGHT